MNETKSSFIVFQLISSPDIMNAQRIYLEKQQEPYNGHNSHDAALDWIKNMGIKDIDYTIIEVVRTS